MKDGKKSPTARMRLGMLGEEVACRFLEENGHRIVKRNFRSGHLEIDIISTDGNGVHFVEVKSRVAPVTADPQENVTPQKQMKIARAALRYLRGAKDPGINPESEVFFDVVAVVFEGGDVKVEWFPEAYLPVYC